MVLSSHLSLGASTSKNGEHSPGVCIPWGVGHAGARGTAVMRCLAHGVGMRGSKGSCLLAPLVMVHSTLLAPVRIHNASGCFPRVTAYRVGDVGTLALLQPAVSALRTLGPSSRNTAYTGITSFRNSLPGTVVASACPAPHCAITGSQAASLREVGAPALGWVSHPPAPPAPHLSPASLLPQSLFQPSWGLP